MKFKDDFEKIRSFLEDGVNFAFTRFSDGEICIMQNRELKLDSTNVVMGKTTYNFGYSSEDHKHFIPEEHGHVRDKLIDAYKFKQENYFVGGICQNCTCASREFAGWMHDLYGEPDDSLTSANLLVNSNYPNFIKKVLPILQTRQVVFVCSENANLVNAGFQDIVKDFRVGKNCIVNDLGLSEQVGQWIDDNDIKNHVFLFAASSLSEIMIHELYSKFPDNTYIDVGTTLHRQLGLKLERNYLRSYWSGRPHPELYRSCV